MTKKKDEERSPSGSPVYRYEDREGPPQPPEQSCRHLAEIEAHVEKYIGKIETVYHELVSDLVHIDVLFVPPTEEFPYQVLVTSGVSDKSMNVPPGVEKFRNVELLIALPPDWPLTQEDLKAESNYWPIYWLKMVGRLPHEYKTWIGWGHSIPNGDPAAPIADTDFVGVTLSPPFMFPMEFFQLPIGENEFVTFLVVVPVYKEEMELKLSAGNEELEKRLVDASVGFTVDPKRKNVG